MPTFESWKPEKNIQFASIQDQEHPTDQKLRTSPYRPPPQPASHLNPRSSATPNHHHHNPSQPPPNLATNPNIPPARPAQTVQTSPKPLTLQEAHPSPQTNPSPSDQEEIKSLHPNDTTNHQNSSTAPPPHSYHSQNKSYRISQT